MTTTIPRVGLAGLGGFAQQHITVLTTLQETGLCRLVATADPFAERQAEVANGLKARGTQIFASLEEMLQGTEMDAVFLATPLPLHMPQSISCLEAGCHVYLEKPPCATLQEYEKMDGAQQKSGKHLVVGFQMQHSASMRFARQQIASGTIGEVEKVWSSTRWSRADGYYDRAAWAGKWTINGSPVFDGPATNALAHVVQGALTLAGPGAGSAPRLKRIGGILRRARPIKSYDNALLEVETENGVQVRLAFTHSTETSEDAMVRCSGSRGDLKISWSGKVTVTPHGAEGVTHNFLQLPGVIAALDFLQGIATKDTSRSVTLQDTLPYLQTVNGARQLSGGAIPFETRQVQRLESEDGRGLYTVTDLDDQFEVFRQDFNRPPALLQSSGNWLTPAELAATL